MLSFSFSHKSFFRSATFPKKKLVTRLYSGTTAVNSQFTVTYVRTFDHGFNVNVLCQVVWDEQRRLERVGRAQLDHSLGGGPQQHRDDFDRVAEQDGLKHLPRLEQAGSGPEGADLVSGGWGEGREAGRGTGAGEGTTAGYGHKLREAVSLFRKSDWREKHSPARMAVEKV